MTAMKLEYAEQVAKDIVALLEAHCERIVVAGSIRRCRPDVNDIDLVLIPKDAFAFNLRLLELQKDGLLQPMVKKDGKTATGGKIRSYVFKGAQIDFNFATPQTWGTLLLVRTGSKEHNIRLASLAKDRGWKLHASGEGLTDAQGRRVAGDTEACPMWRRRRGRGEVV
jgi:DNA polymerase/3'-5' exonuclease PolX